MKCDELKPLVFSLKDLAYIDEPAVEKNFGNPHDHAVYKATEVDAAIAELKAENERLVKCCKEYDSRQRIDERIKSGYAQQLRATKRALYKTLANWALSTLAWLDCIDQGEPAKWSEMRRKCLSKMEEYK